MPAASASVPRSIPALLERAVERLAAGRRRALVPVLALAGLALLGLSAWWGGGMLVRLGLWAWLAAVKLPVAWALRCAASEPGTWLFAALVLAWATVWRAFARSQAGLPAVAGLRRWAAPVAAAAGLAFVAQHVAGAGSTPPNRHGFYATMGVNTEILLDSPPLPPYRVRTNSLGLRGPEWSPETPPGTTRALLVGDSFVWGAGIQRPEDMLDRRLAEELSARDGRRWEVLNVGNSPAAFWYYANALERFGREVKPRLYVMSFLGWYDLEPWEVHRVKADLPPRAVGLLDAFEFGRSLHLAGAEAGARFARAKAADPAVLADLQGELKRLVEFLEQSDGYLLVWEPMGTISFFDPVRSHPRVGFASWADVADAPAALRGARQAAAWQEDPTLAFQGDGHPTPAGNALFARTIAARALELLRSRGVAAP